MPLQQTNLRLRPAAGGQEEAPKEPVDVDVFRNEDEAQVVVGGVLLQRMGLEVLPKTKGLWIPSPWETGAALLPLKAPLVLRIRRPRRTAQHWSRRGNISILQKQVLFQLQSPRNPA